MFKQAIIYTCRLVHSHQGPLLGLVLAVIAFVSIGRVLTKDIVNREVDFHSYWYAGHFIWEREDPYRAVFEEREPRLPVQYWDGLVVTEGKIAQEHLAKMPANTAPIVLILSIFSRLSWPMAAALWAGINVCLALIIGILTVHILGYNLNSPQAAFVVLSFLGFIATREAIETGQTSLLVLACSLGAFVSSKSQPLLAGVLLGVGLSKYSLSFPVFLSILLQGRFLVVLIGLAVQVIGVILISVIGDSAPFEVLFAYLRILDLHAGLPGLHLTSTLLSGSGSWSIWVVGVGSIILWITVFIRFIRLRQNWSSFQDFVLLVLMMIWNLLVFYHRRYDHIAMILFTGLSSLWLWEDPKQRLKFSTPLRVAYSVLTVIFLGVWMLPLYIVLGQTAYVFLFVMCVALALFMTLLILFTITRTTLWSMN